jgi:uncharacterized protein (TIGR02118 family)
LRSFIAWWIEEHAPLVVAAKQPHLKRYVVNLRWPEDPLPGKPEDETDWDGVAEQWFETEDDFRAAFAPGAPSASRVDAVNHVSRQARIIVQENPIEVSDAPQT